MNKLLDLRFVIGLFFIATGLLLVGYHFLGGKAAVSDTQVNLWAGLVFLGFGIFMVVLSGLNKDASPPEG